MVSRLVPQTIRSPGKRERAGLDGWHADGSWGPTRPDGARGSELGDGSWIGARGGRGRMGEHADRLNGWHADRSWLPGPRHTRRHRASSDTETIRAPNTPSQSPIERAPGPDMKSAAPGPDTKRWAPTQRARPRHKEGAPGPDTERRASAERGAGPRHKERWAPTQRHKEGAPGPDTERRAPTQRARAPTQRAGPRQKERRPAVAAAVQY